MRNWMERHINWGYLLLFWLFCAPLWLICMNASFLDSRLVGFLASVCLWVTTVMVCWWPIGRKGRSDLWILLTLLFWPTPLLLKNKRGNL